ncbi:MAG: alpha/beta fold hydrolase [Anaerolineae bacterium]|nr:alpha/beta fold hydrolase [Anaerolineae bacterium]
MEDSFDDQDTGLGIAVIGFAGRFPGADNAETFWQNLCSGVDSTRFFSDEELLAAGVPEAILTQPNFVKAARRFEQPEYFDAAFFDFTQREASWLDPQQRLFLEVAWEALEHAGYAAGSAGLARKGLVGVYAGAAQTSYLFNCVLETLPEPATLFQGLLGNATFGVAAWAAHKFDLTGPVVTLEAACATGLYTIHQACRALWLDECRMALAGAISIDLVEHWGYQYLHGGHLSPDGHCYPFDARANGTAFGGGAGVVVLKRLEDARADGDTIYAVIKGSAIGNDGADKASFTAPSVEGQIRVVLEADACAGVEFDSISYVEAHGTGTPLGDPVEVMALTKAFRAGTARKGFCRLGSTKGNIGHTDAASSMAGIIKTVMALQRRQIPPTLNFETPNPAIDFANSPFVVNATLTPWEDVPLPRRAGVSAFGFGGYNAHVILEEAPPTPPGSASRPAHLLVLSARTASALETQTRQLADYLRRHPELALADVAYTLQLGRRAFLHRRMVVAQTLSEAAQQLEVPAAHQTAMVTVSEPGVVWMFPGQGAQYVGMGRELYDAEPVFRAAVDQCAELLKPHLDGVDLRAVIYPEPSQVAPAAAQLAQTRFTQPALFAIEYALAQLWLQWGRRPQALIGHSLGEYVAACLAGVFSLADALALVAARGRLMQAQPAGAMLGVALSADEVAARIAPPLSLAVHNAPHANVVSGPAEAIDALEQQLTAQQIVCRRLHTSHAFHSEMMAPMVESFAALVAGVTRRAPQIPFISNATGTWITDEQATSPDYWAMQSRQAVHFSEGAQRLLAESFGIFLEIGPGNTLCTLLKQQPRTPALAVASMRHPQQAQPDMAALLNAVGQLWLNGVAIPWAALYAQERRLRVALPTYPFERQRCWIGSPPGILPLNLLAGELLRPVEVSAETFADTSPVTPAGASTIARPRNEREQVLVTIWQQVLGRTPVGIYDDFFDLGGDSLTGLQVIGKARAAGIELSLALLTQRPTIAGLVEMLADGASPGDPSTEPAIISDSDLTRLWVSYPKLNPAAKRRLFCFPYAGGGAAGFYRWPEYLPADVEVCAIRAPGRESRSQEPPLTDFTTFIETLVAAIRPLLDRPFAFFGHSLGALVAFEVTRRLRREGAPLPERLLVSAYRAPQLPGRYALIHDLPADAFLQGVLKYGGIPSAVMENAELLEAMLPALRADFALAETYDYIAEPPLPCPISVFNGSEDGHITQEELAAWNAQTQATAAFHSFPGGHFYLNDARKDLLATIGCDWKYR